MDPFLAAFLGHVEADPRAPIALGPRHIASRDELAEGMLESAARIERLGLAPGSIVGLVAPAGPGFLGGWLALRKAGACAILMDATTPAEERLRIARHLGAAALWTIGEGWSREDARGRLERLDPPEPRVLEGAASLKLTSGSTGDPAGIVVTSEQLFADYVQLESSMGLSARDRPLVVLPLSHSYGFSVLASPAWVRGTPLVFPCQHDALEVASHHGASVVPSVPSWYRVRRALDAHREWPACTRLFVSAGAQLAPELASAGRARTGRAIHALYGSSECGGITYDRRGDATERGSVGTPVDGVTIEQLDEENEVGRVVVRSRAVAHGYLPASDRGKLLGGGRFLTGDLGRVRAGELYLLGRADDWINVKGMKVNPREVETVLAELGGVEDVAVVGKLLPDGRGELVRAVIACEPGALSYQDVVVWCRERLAAHKVPRSVLFVRELPRTERGKLDRKALLAVSRGGERS